jgi:hypothetical protein
LQSIDLDKLTQALLKEFSPYNISPIDIVLDKGDGLFSYSIKTQLFNRLITFTSTAVNLEATFRTLIRASDREIAADCLHKIVAIGREYMTDNCYFDLNVHAAFDSPASRDAFLAPPANKSNLDILGTLGYKKLTNPEQMIRFQVDRSWVFPDAVYVTWGTVGMNLTQLLEPKPIWTPFFQMMEPLGLKLTDE